ncbi:MAG TPA: hypothetical protein VFH27_03695 [Longimicrobiaceae bacterium]|nr:hypothetical protein [Longimicrobiaceae bacterium]
MNPRRTLAALLVAVPLSSFAAGCKDAQKDTAAPAQDQTQRDLDLALQPDTTQQPRLADVPLSAPPTAQPAPAAQPDAQAPPAPAPAPKPVRRTPPPPPTRTRPEPRPEQPQEPAGPRYVTRTAAAGTRFGVRIDDELSTARMQVGDVFTSTLSEAITDPEGNVVIPAGATVYGRVTSATRGHGSQPATLGVTFTSIAYGGDRYSIDGSSVISEPTVQRVGRQSTAETAGKVGAGAAVGAIAGRVLGNSRRATIAGAVIGAGAGTVVAARTAQVDAVIPAGSSARIQTDRPISVRRQTD